MKILSNKAIKLISGGAICMDGECVQISSKGIPADTFLKIEKNFQLCIDNKITLFDVYTNLADSIEYVNIFNKNMENGLYTTSYQ